MRTGHSPYLFIAWISFCLAKIKTHTYIKNINASEKTAQPVSLHYVCFVSVISCLTARNDWDFSCFVMGECNEKAWMLAQALLCNRAVREGLIRVAHPAGGRWPSKMAQVKHAILSNPVEASHPPCVGEYKSEKAWTWIQAFSLNWRWGRDWFA